MAQAVVCIVMGSANDWPIMQGAAEMLARFHIPYEVTVSSAHRAPQRTATLAHEAAQRGVQVMIAGAGGAAHLAGVLAAQIVALHDPDLATRLRQYKAELAAGVELAAATLQTQLQAQQDGSSVR